MSMAMKKCDYLIEKDGKLVDIRIPITERDATAAGVKILGKLSLTKAYRDIAKLKDIISDYRWIRIPYRKRGLTSSGYPSCCHANVDVLVKRYGGWQIQGWRRDGTGLTVHSVWMTPEGKIVDPTPQYTQIRKGIYRRTQDSGSVFLPFGIGSDFQIPDFWVPKDRREEKIDAIYSYFLDLREPPEGHFGFDVTDRIASEKGRCTYHAVTLDDISKMPLKRHHPEGLSEFQSKFFGCFDGEITGGFIQPSAFTGKHLLSDDHRKMVISDKKEALEYLAEKYADGHWDPATFQLARRAA